MTYNQLLYFVTTVKYNSITKASNKLFVTQPAISLAIKTLEQEFHTTLFERHNNQLILTDSGKFLYEEALNLIKEFNNLETNFNKYISENATLRIGVPPMIGTILFPQIFSEYSIKNKNVKLKTTEFGSYGLIEALKNNEIDLAITSTKNIDDKDIESYVVKQTELVYSIKKDHPFSNKKTITIEDIKNEPIVLLKEDSYQYMIINERFKEAGIKPNIILNSNQLSTIKQVLLYNTAGAFMFKEIIENDSELIGIPLDRPIKIDILLLWHKNKSNDMTINNFIDFIKELK